MASIKFVCVLLLAFAAVQGTLANQGSSKDLDGTLRNAVALVEAIIAEIKTGILNSQPILDDLKNQIKAKSLTDVLDKLRKDLDTIFEAVTSKLTAIGKSLIAGLDNNRKNIGACLDTLLPALKVILDGLGASIADVITAIKAENDAELKDLLAQINDLTLQLDAAVDDSIATSLNCIKPGSADVKKCLDNSRVTLTDKVSELGAALKELTTERGAIVGTIIGQFLNNSIPLLNSTLSQIGKPLTDLGTCVENLKVVKLY